MVIEIRDITNKKGEQDILIPKKMRINDDKGYLKKVSNTLYVIPYHNPWQNLVDSTDSFTADFTGFIELQQDIWRLRIETNLAGIPESESIMPGVDMQVQGTFGASF